MDGSKAVNDRRYSRLDRRITNFTTQLELAESLLRKHADLKESMHALCQHGLDCMLDFSEDERATPRQAHVLEGLYMRYTRIIDKVISLESSDIRLVADLKTYKMHTEERIYDLKEKIEQRRATGEKVGRRLSVSSASLAMHFFKSRSVI